MARQGQGTVVAEPMRVVDKKMEDVARDGATMGEVVMRGNGVMKGYFENPKVPPRPFVAAISTPVISGSGTTTATSSYATGPRT